MYEKMSFIKVLEFLANNYDRATTFCALMGRFTQMDSVKSNDDAHPVFSKTIICYSNITWQLLRVGGWEGVDVDNLHLGPLWG